MNRAGEFVANLTGDAQYFSFKPSKLPPEDGINIDKETSVLLLETKEKITELNLISEYISNTDLFISMYVRKEALISSQIEGTRCTLEDILSPESENNINLDVNDVINYVNAVSFALERRRELPLCCRLLKETHKILMNNVRGEEKKPGEFRTSQNWIGAAGCSLKDARYIPPNVTDMNEAMSALEKFINYSDEYDYLINAALIHYQFETIHPFLDGNGRLGRMLILLYLIEKKIIFKPIIYVSYFLKKNQVEYYDRISEVRKKGNYEQWIKFFLEAVKNAAEDSANSIKELSALHDKNVSLLPKSKRLTDNSRILFDYIEQHPIISIGRTATALNLSYNTVSTNVNKFIEYGILYKVDNKSRNKVFIYKDYVNILKKDT